MTCPDCEALRIEATCTRATLGVVRAERDSLRARVAELETALERSQSAHQALKDAYWKETGWKADRIASLEDQLERALTGGGK